MEYVTRRLGALTVSCSHPGRCFERWCKLPGPSLIDITRELTSTGQMYNQGQCWKQITISAWGKTTTAAIVDEVSLPRPIDGTTADVRRSVPDVVGVGSTSLRLSSTSSLGPVPMDPPLILAFSLAPGTLPVVALAPHHRLLQVARTASTPTETPRSALIFRVALSPTALQYRCK